VKYYLSSCCSDGHLLKLSQDFKLLCVHLLDRCLCRFESGLVQDVFTSQIWSASVTICFICCRISFSDVEVGCTLVHHHLPTTSPTSAPGTAPDSFDIFCGLHVGRRRHHLDSLIIQEVAVECNPIEACYSGNDVSHGLDSETN